MKDSDSILRKKNHFYKSNRNLQTNHLYIMELQKMEIQLQISVYGDMLEI